MDTHVDFDVLCAKVASGEATPVEVHQAFQSLDRDLEAFATSVNKQLLRAKPQV